MAKDKNEQQDVFRERKRWVFLGLPWTFTVYHVREDMITIDRGLLSKQEDDCYMYKVADVHLDRSFFERMFGLGTITCFTGDTTDSKLIFKHIKHSREIKNYILEAADKERIRRRTVNMQGVGYHEDPIGGDVVDDIG